MVNHMSRTDAHAPWNIRARDSIHREEHHVWCENETVDTARPWKYGRHAQRAVYERELVEVVTERCKYVMMIDLDTKEHFKARMTPVWRDPDKVEYDREKHPRADFIYKSTFYGGEMWKTRIILDGTYERPIYRHRLIGWEEQPIRKCDIDDPRGVCYYTAWDDINVSHKHHRENRRIHDEKPRRAEARRALKNAVADYNAYGDTVIEPDPNWDHRWYPW